MKLYWPCAKYKHEMHGKEYIDNLYTTDRALSVDKAKAAIETWKNEYKFDVIEAWIDVYENGQKIERIDVN